MGGMGAHDLMAGARFIGSARTTKRYRLVVYSGYPALVAGQLHIEGELYSVPTSTLPQLDEYEGVPDEYTRQGIELERDVGHIVEAYFLADERLADAQDYAGCRWMPPVTE